MPIQAKTYTVGDLGGVRRLDNLTGAWIDVPVTNTFPGASGCVLFDVETDPNDGNKVFAIGEGNIQANLYGIYVSTNGGTSWFVPGGNYQTNLTQGEVRRWYEVWVYDSNNIMVSGDNGYVAISTDGGLTFNLSTQVPALSECVQCPPRIPPLYSLHFISPLIGVVGAVEHVLITYDGGVSWTVLNGGNFILGISGNVQGVVGIHLSADQQTIVACGRGRMFQSTDAGNTFNEVFDWVRSGRHLTWINDNELWGFGSNDMIIKTVDGGTTWSIVSPNLIGGPTHLAGHFYLNQNGFFSTNADILSTSNGASTGTLSETSPYSVFAVWTWYREFVCYLLTDCSGAQSPIVISNNLSQYLGQVIQIPELYGETCWTVSETQDCTNSVTLPNSAVITAYPDCISCVPPQCYSLTECTGVIPPFNTNDPSLAPFVGKVIRICITAQGTTTCYCFTVADIGPCQDGIPLPDGWEIDNCVDDCNACLPPPPPPFELHPRRIKPGYYTPGCPPEYTEKVNCNFANQLYDEMVSVRYGITICCDHDVDKWSIKKQLLDLKAIYDPDLCKCFLQQCCPPTCVEAEIQVFNPIACTAPSGVTATITPDCICYRITVGPQAPQCLISYTGCDGTPATVSVPRNSSAVICSQSVPVGCINWPYSPLIVAVGPCVNGVCTDPT